MTTVGTLVKQVDSYIQRLTTVTSEITRNLQARGSLKVQKQTMANQKEIRDLHAQADAYDRKFEEEESAIRAMGGKTRMQTLQEFVLLFFFVSYWIFTSALILLAYARGETKMALQLFGGMAIAFLLICCILIKLA